MTVHTRGTTGFGRHTVSPSDRGDDWRDFAACQDHDPELWFPLSAKGRPPADKPANAAAIPALMICAGCPVVVQCGRYAIRSGQRDGIWGGMEEWRLRAAVEKRRAS